MRCESGFPIRRFLSSRQNSHRPQDSPVGRGTARGVGIIRPAGTGRPLFPYSIENRGKQPYPAAMDQSRKASITVLHHMRWVAAFMVAYSHVRQNLLVDYADLPHPGIVDKLLFAFSNYGFAGVIIFFVLSGFLVGEKAIGLFNSPAIATEWPYFLADRFSRIFVVLWPTLLLCLVLLLFLFAAAANAPFMTAAHWGWAMQQPIESDSSPFRWFNAAVLLNEFNSETLTLDSPLWSLAYEWFYYMAALGIVLALRRVHSPAALAIIAYAAVLFVAALVNNREILYLGVVWLLGVGANVLFRQHVLKIPFLRWLGLALVIGSLIAVRFMTVNPLVLGAAVAFMIAHCGWAQWRGGARWGEKLASFSYSFYLVHFPITLLVLGLLYRFDHLRHRLPLDAKGIGIAFATLAGAIVFARLFAFCTEDRTRMVRNWLWRPAPPQAVHIAAESKRFFF